MTAKQWAFLACVTLSAAAWSACGGDDDDGGGGAKVTTGLPDGDKLSSLDDDDAEQACRNTAKSFNSVLPESELEKIGCAIAGLSAVISEKSGDVGPDDVAMCKKVQSECLKGETGDLAPVVAEEDDCEGATASDTFADCDATVAEYESCASKVASEVKAALRKISCDGLSDPEKLMKTISVEIDVSDAPECKALQTKCPDVDLSGASDDDSDDSDSSDDGSG